jgi:hypothetical protein
VLGTHQPDDVVPYCGAMDAGGEEANDVHREIRMAEITAAMKSMVIA